MSFYPSEHSTHMYGSVIGIALGLVFLRTVAKVLRAPTSRVPGPWYSKWTSLVLDFYFLTGKRSFYVHALHQQYGPVVRIAPNEIDITDLEAVKTIYSTKETFRKSNFYRRIVAQDQQSMFSTVDIDFHRRHRRLLASPMSESSLKSMTARVDARAQLAVEKMGQEMKSRGATDVFKFWLFMATDVIGELTFGDSFRMLELGHKNEYVGELERVGRMGALRATFPSLVGFSRIIPLPIFRQAQEASQNLRRYASESLDRYRRLVVASPDLVQQTLFTKLFKAEKEDTMPFNEIRDEALSYLVAGSDTTSNTLTFLTWSVCRNPRLRASLVEELQKLPADFTEAQLRDLPLLNHIIDETLRLYSAAPSGLPRVVPPGGIELAGYWFDEGTVVCAQAYSMHRESTIYPNPDAFVPSRWAEPTKAMKEAYMPFGRGPRVCIGQHLAQIELRLATARFFLAFPEAKMSSLEGMSDLDMEPRIHFLLAPSGSRCLVQAQAR
ncbi:cytochrome p450 [Hirsutella rhossiliensis]|uniref:Cytochrome p450 domain-containing protein n=1 Tax=Hirsutella rhossiliensis TaxID=111463 RepID=A0A9P8MTG1_9HYPO|nr:cytochrome p450 domain-containing protein [Hirsutella rhossiliensis]KAH0961703.1 cytochrome p450 domain-containing protein [Hirsutella rhossiliensis]